MPYRYLLFLTGIIVLILYGGGYWISRYAGWI